VINLIKNYECPVCGHEKLKISPRKGYFVSFDKIWANEETVCPNCKRKIYYSIQKLYPVKDKN
jgi:transcription elongation factor Elf1